MRQSEASTRNMEANVSDELKTSCTWCGRECRVETFGPSEFIENPFSIWVCSNAEIFGGTCTHALAYMSEEDWQEEPRSDELIEAMARAITLCPVCEGEGTVCDGLDEAGCSIPCPPCSGTGYDARALLPVIRAHLEPTSEMVQAVMGCGPIGCCNISSTEARDVILAALAASPIGDVG